MLSWISSPIVTVSIAMKERSLFSKTTSIESCRATYWFLDLNLFQLTPQKWLNASLVSNHEDRCENSATWLQFLLKLIEYKKMVGMLSWLSSASFMDLSPSHTTPEFFDEWINIKERIRLTPTEDKGIVKRKLLCILSQIV